MKIAFTNAHIVTKWEVCHHGFHLLSSRLAEYDQNYLEQYAWEWT